MGREQRANAERREAIGKMVDAVTGEYVDRGQIVALGFAMFIAQEYPNYKESLPVEEGRKLRRAFFAGAQHLFASTFSFLGPGDEPTEKDLQRFTLVAHELNSFVAEWKQRHNITDPDVGPPPETKQ